MRMKFSSEIVPQYRDRWELSGATMAVFLEAGPDESWEIFRWTATVDADDYMTDIDDLERRGQEAFATRLREVLMEGRGSWH